MDTDLGAELVEILRYKKGSIYKSNESKLVPQAGVRLTQVYILSQKMKAKHCTQNTTSEVAVHSRRILHQSNSMQQSRYMAAIYLIIA